MNGKKKGSAVALTTTEPESETHRSSEGNQLMKSTPTVPEGTDEPARFDVTLMRQIAGEHAGKVVVHLDPEGGEVYVWAEISLDFEIEIESHGHADVTWNQDDNLWTVDPYFSNEPALTPTDTRAVALVLLNAADLAEELNAALTAEVR